MYGLLTVIRGPGFQKWPVTCNLSAALQFPSPVTIVNSKLVFDMPGKVTIKDIPNPDPSKHSGTEGRPTCVMYFAQEGNVFF